ncbi:carbohydrate esterase family 1 protein [Xylaria bambusicola]|uniref:carbohydrate esterase family 1 protein n=1 Tax=Xylaria bambusicola TaxID=326684 RepID=UPI002008C7AF|nr:carbohydrate esterase family 1 protein [Xylaria bambusicola]KAI0513061.1 carbohydrate esterase family 1 protein [Xylaria bambusicola]
MKFTTTVSWLAATGSAMSASLQPVTGFGTNPTNLGMYIYVPDRVATSPALIVALHPCGGNAQQWYGGTQLPAAANSGGHILIYPQTTRYSNCWDVQNAGSLTHGGQGDALGIINMVNYAVTKYNVDKTKIFVMGGSSGAMMTSVMAGSYPDVFEAGAVYSGVAFACFAGSKSDPTPFGANQTCAQGMQHTPEQWAQFVYNAYPGYTGKRPRMLVAHGLADGLVRPQCGYEQLKQWSAVLGLKNTKNNTGSAVAEGSQYTEIVYGDGTQLVGYFGQGVGHIAPPVVPVMLKFFGLS